MTRCFAEPAAWGTDQVVLSEEETHHLVHVLRKRRGDRVVVMDGAGLTAEAEVMGVDHKQADLFIHRRVTHPPPRCTITLLQAPPKGQLIELIIQKAVELGALHVIPVITERTEVRIKDKQVLDKTRRWQLIAVNACKQCGSAWLPMVHPPRHLDEALGRTGHFDLFLTGALHPEAVPLQTILAAEKADLIQQAALLIGPEGDFSPDEYAAIRDIGSRLVSFGDRVLRSETAALYALSILNFFLL